MLAATHDDTITGIISAIRLVAGNEPAVGLHEPTFAGHERDYVLECIDTGWVSSAGSFVNRFEQELCRHTGAQFAVAVVSGTAALHIALLDACVRAGDEVLVPSLTFAATANSVAHAGAIPHFVDSTWDNLGMDTKRLANYLREVAVPGKDGTVNRKTGRVIRAIVPVHIFGHAVDLEAVTAVAHDFDLTVVEDCTEALGSLSDGVPVGGKSRYAVLSFNGNKIVTTGGGGAVLTDDADVARRVRHLTTTAKLPHRWEFNHDAVGYNYRLPNINAALGCAQLEQLPGFVARKRQLAERYIEAFANVADAKIFREPARCRSNYWLNALVLDRKLADRRDELLAACHGAGILARPVWRLLHELPHFSSSPRMATPVAEDIARRIVNLPSSPHLIAS